MKSHKKRDYNSCNPYGGSSGDFCRNPEPEATQTKKNAPSFIFQRSGITPMISGLR